MKRTGGVYHVAGARLRGVLETRNTGKRWEKMEPKRERSLSMNRR